MKGFEKWFARSVRVENEKDLQVGGEGIFSLDERQRADLKAAVERSNGLVIGLVHPYFEKHQDDLDLGRSTQDVRRVEERIRKFVANKSREKPPIFLFEERRHAAMTLSAFKNDNPDQQIYLVPTEAASGRPLFKIGSTVHQGSNAWKETKRYLQDLGVKKILLGGMYNDPEPRIGCVNEVGNALTGMFEVELTSFAYPVARKHTYM